MMKIRRASLLWEESVPLQWVLPDVLESEGATIHWEQSKMPKLLLGPTPPEGDKMLGCERECEKRKTYQCKGTKEIGRQKAQIEVSPRERGNQNNPILRTYLGEESKHVPGKPILLQGLATPSLQ